MTKLMEAIYVFYDLSPKRIMVNLHKSQTASGPPLFAKFSADDTYLKTDPLGSIL